MKSIFLKLFVGYILAPLYFLPQIFYLRLKLFVAGCKRRKLLRKHRKLLLENLCLKVKKEERI